MIFTKQTQLWATFQIRNQNNHQPPGRFLCAPRTYHSPAKRTTAHCWHPRCLVLPVFELCRKGIVRCAPALLCLASFLSHVSMRSIPVVSYISSSFIFIAVKGWGASGSWRTPAVGEAGGQRVGLQPEELVLVCVLCARVPCNTSFIRGVLLL